MTPAAVEPDPVPAALVPRRPRSRVRPTLGRASWSRSNLGMEAHYWTMPRAAV